MLGRPDQARIQGPDPDRQPELVGHRLHDAGDDGAADGRGQGLRVPEGPARQRQPVHQVGLGADQGRRPRRDHDRHRLHARRRGADGRPASRSSPVAPCEGTGYEIGSMSLIKGARNPEAAKKFYDWALTAEMQSQGPGREVVPGAVEQERPTPSDKAPDLSTIKLIDYDFKKYGSSDERKRLLQKWDTEVASPAAVDGCARAQDHRGLASDRHPLDGGRAGSASPLLPWYGLDRQFLHAGLAVRRLSAGRRRRAGAVPRRCRARSRGWRRSASCCLLPLLAVEPAKDRSAVRPAADRRRRGRLRLFPAAGLRHRPARLAVRSG